MMITKRSESLHENPKHYGNGNRLRHTYIQNEKLKFHILRDRYGNFHPQVLTILCNQEEECVHLASILYTKRLTQE